MTTIRRPRCPVCGAQLRRDRAPGQLCDPCDKVGPSPRDHLPADFYTHPEVLAWLRAYDFGAFFRHVRRLTGWSQQTLGGVGGLTQSHISALERGDCQLRDIEFIAAIADALQIPPALLNLPDIRATVGQQGITEPMEVSWVDRRDFGQHIAATVLGIAAARLDTDRLLALLPQAEPTGTRHLGIADVEIIEQATAEFARQDFAHGSGLTRDAAVAQLRAVLPLLDAEIAPDLRPRLMVATAHLAAQTGWMAFECHHHDAARRLWMIGLDLARDAEHPQATDLTVFLLYDMAMQAVHLDRPDEALHLVRVGRAASSSSRPASASTLCCLANVQARASAAAGDAAQCERALGQCEEHFTAIDTTTAPPWGSHLSATTLSGFQGIAHYTLSLTHRDTATAEQAVPLLRTAVDHIGPEYARFRGFYLPDLSGAHALTGDVSTAVTIGHQAVDAVASLSSPRAHDRLRTLHTVLEPLQKSPDVADLRHRLVTTAA